MSRSSQTYFNLFLGILALAIMGVVGLILKDSFIERGGGNIPPERTPAAREASPSGDLSASEEDFQSDIFVFSADSFKTQPENGETDPITAQLNAEGIAHFSKGEYSEAVEVLERAHERDQRNPFIRENLAYAKGNLAWSQIENRMFNEALLNFQEALQIQGKEPMLWVGQGLTYLRLQDTHRAIESLDKAIKLDPANPDAYKIMGNLYYRQDEMEMAVGYYEQSLERNPGDETLKLQIEKTRREMSAESGFQQQASRAFTVKFEGREESDTARTVLRELDSAYADIGKEMSYYPQKSITVILYTNQQFRDVTQTPAWTSGLFDGKIRIPAGGAGKDPDVLRRVLYHEYSHALVHELTGGAPVPRWLDEGLAEYFEDPDDHLKEKALLSQIRSGIKLVPLSRLHGSFMGLGPEEAGLVYAESFSAVKSLIDRNGVYRIRLLLEDLGRRTAFEKSFYDQILVPYDQFQGEWEESLYGAAS